MNLLKFADQAGLVDLLFHDLRSLYEKNDAGFGKVEMFPYGVEWSHHQLNPFRISKIKKKKKKNNA